MLGSGVSISRHNNMKEFRKAGELRVLFAFDSRRCAIFVAGWRQVEPVDAVVPVGSSGG